MEHIISQYFFANSIKCTIGSVVECVIAIHATRVRFSDSAYFSFFFLTYFFVRLLHQQPKIRILNFTICGVPSTSAAATVEKLPQPAYGGSGGVFRHVPGPFFAHFKLKKKIQKNSWGFRFQPEHRLVLSPPRAHVFQTFFSPRKLLILGT